jgi:hypothetical protein
MKKILGSTILLMVFAVNAHAAKPANGNNAANASSQAESKAASNSAVANAANNNSGSSTSNGNNANNNGNGNGAANASEQAVNNAAPNSAVVNVPSEPAVVVETPPSAPAVVETAPVPVPAPVVPETMPAPITVLEIIEVVTVPEMIDTTGSYEAVEIQPLETDENSGLDVAFVDILLNSADTNPVPETPVDYGTNKQLPVNAVPVPAAVWLFGSALIGLLGLGKRKQTKA